MTKSLVPELTRLDSFYKKHLKKALRGDSDSWDILYEGYDICIRKIIIKYLGYCPELDELAQEVWTRIFLKGSTFKGNSKLSTWIFRVTANVALMRIRTKRMLARRGSHQSLEFVTIPDIATPEDYLRARRNLESALSSINELPSRDKEIISKYFLEGLSAEEVANGLDRTCPAIKSNLARIRRVLSHKMKVKRCDERFVKVFWTPRLRQRGGSPIEVPG